MFCRYQLLVSNSLTRRWVNRDDKDTERMASLGGRTFGIHRTRVVFPAVTVEFSQDVLHHFSPSG